MPKTGGTFVHGVFKKIVEKYKKDHLFRWYLNRIGYKMNLVTPIYQKLSNVEYNEYPNNNVKGQHAGVSFISKMYRSLPVISVKRDPIKKFISVYYFKWWERFPTLPLIQLESLFPHYPEISIEEYFELSYEHEMKYFFGNDYREDIGVLSWQLIRMYSNDPMYVYNNIKKENYTDFIATYFADVKFFEMDHLTTEFESFIKTTSFAEFSDFFKTEERIYPPGSTIKKRSETISEALTYNIKSKEWLLYKFFPEYNL